MTEILKPPLYLKSPFVQTVLASSSFRKLGNNPMADAAREMILDCGEGVRLQGFYSPSRDKNAKGIVALLTGWEGSASSAYILSTGKFLYDHNYAVFRLNFRDHGESHHLNQGLFYGTLLDEVFGAVQQVAAIEADLPLFLVGFSIGANFALRIARKCVENPIDTLAHVVSISPVLDPEKSTRDIDRFYYIRRYFMKKWRRSLMKKQLAFPDVYDFYDVLSLDKLTEMTALIVERYSDFKDATSYYNGYSLLEDTLISISKPTTIITAADDPIIPVGDFYALKLNELTNLIITDRGGHNGFLETITGRTFYEKKILSIFDALASSVL